jgi:C-terminal processing protease CtpA/Prc
VNSQSASAAEIFARVVQIEKRGMVIGDKTSGEVGRAQVFLLDQGAVTIIHYAVEVTVSRLIMPDGKDLEGNGVAPDTKLLPTQEDMAAGRDPVLAAAALSVGVAISPEEAGKMFPVIWLTH